MKGNTWCEGFREHCAEEDICTEGERSNNRWRKLHNEKLHD